MGPDSIIQYITDRLPELWLRTGEHLLLTGCSTMAALLMGVPVGILVFRNSWLRSPVMGVISTLQTIPSLAMLAFLLAMLNKIGAAPALIALTLYALLPIVRNTLTGLEGVSPQLMEAARGIGMTDHQQLRMVRMPLATPVIIAGIRTAAVVGVGIATLSAFIGAGGLGQFINRGLALSDTRLILLGAVPSAMLALLVDFSVGAFGWGLRPERKRDRRGSLKALIRPVALMMPLILVLAGVASYFIKPSVRSGPAGVSENMAQSIRIGSKNFTEQVILGEIMAQLIEARTNHAVERRFNLGGTMICHGALVNGEIDLYAEYTGTALTAILKEAVISEPEHAFQLVSDTYHERFGIRWLRPFGFNNTYAITVRADHAKSKGWKRISDLKTEAPNLRAGFTAEFAERPDGYPGVSKAYGLNFGKTCDLDPSLMYQAVYKGEVDVICAFATDGRIASYKLKPLEDDRNFFPPYYAAPIIREESIEKHPEVVGVLSLIGGLIDDANMQRLNFEVDGKGQSPSDVAKRFLRSKGLI
ncbi:MAG: ABC transporter permease subunit [Desulfobacterales bacterium]|nr:ABC transporter permease subunit [Desulfobacterales bacterium]